MMSTVLESFGLNKEDSDDDSTKTSEEEVSEEGSSFRGARSKSNDDSDEQDFESKELSESESGDSSQEDRTTDVQKEKKRSKIVKPVEQQLEEEKGFRTRLQRELKEAKEQLGSFSTLKSQFDELRGELNVSKQQKVEPEFTFEDHPLEYLKNQIEQLREGIGGIAQYTNTTHQQTEQQRNMQFLLRKADASFTAFSEEKEDFPDAMTFLRSSRLKQFKAMGYSDEEANQNLSGEIVNLLQRAYGEGQNPAEIAYKISKLNGFSSLKDSKESIQKISNGQNKNKSMSSIGSGSSKKGENLMTMEDLAGMSDDDFDKHWASYNKSQKRMG